MVQALPLQQGYKYSEDIGGYEKLCRSCGEYWPADRVFFNRNSDNLDGLDNLCKDCRKQARNRNKNAGS